MQGLLESIEPESTVLPRHDNTFSVTTLKTCQDV